MHRSRLCALVIDCQDADLDRAAAFWSGALGRAVAERDAKYVKLASRPDDPVMLLQAVTHPSRVHLDIESDDVEAEVERLEALGARRLEKIHTWWVLEAPTGHRFCVVRPQRGPLGEGANVWPSTTPPRVPTSKDEVAAAADAFSAAWRSGRLEALEGLVDPEVVFVQPGGSSRIEGRAACIDSFRGFLAAATIERYQEGDRQIDVNGNTAVVTYRWTMAWRRAGQDHRESGRDLLVLGRRDGRWRITWRTLLPS